MRLFDSEPQRTGPGTLCAAGQRRQHLLAVADATGSQYWQVTHRFDDLWPEDDGADFAAVAAAFAALRYDKIQSGLFVLYRLFNLATERADQASTILYLFDLVRRRGAEDLVDLGDLVELVGAREERVEREHLEEDAAHAPHVHLVVVEPGAREGG